MYRKAKNFINNIKKERDKKIIKEKRSWCKAIISSGEVNNTLHSKEEKYYFDKRVLK